MNRFCENCGAKLAEGAKFCEECGAKILPMSEVPPQSAQDTGQNFDHNQQSGNIGSFGNESQYSEQNYRSPVPGSQNPDAFYSYNQGNIQNQGYPGSAPGQQQPGSYNNFNPGNFQNQGYPGSAPGPQQPGSFNGFNPNYGQNQGYNNPGQQPGQYYSPNDVQNRGYAPAPGNPKKPGLPKGAIIAAVALVAIAAISAFLVLGKIKGGQNTEESIAEETTSGFDRSSSQNDSDTRTSKGSKASKASKGKSAREQAAALDNDSKDTDMTERKAKETSGNQSDDNSDSSQNTSSNDEEFLPSTFAKKGKRDILQDGTIMYMNSIGDYVANVWVEDNGKYYYTGPDGSIIKDNYSADGYWCGSDGAWDQSVKQRNEDPEPMTGTYEGYVKTWKVAITKDGRYGTASYTYTQFGGTPQVYDLTPLGHGVYLAEENSGLKALMSVMDNGNVLVVSEAGITETCTLK